MITRMDFAGYAMRADEHKLKATRHHLAAQMRKTRPHMPVEFTPAHNYVKFTGSLQNEAARTLSVEEIGLLVNDYMFGGHIEVDRDNDTFSGEYWID